MKESDYLSVLKDINENNYTDETEYWCNCITTGVYALSNILNKDNAMQIKAFIHIINDKLTELDIDTNFKIKEKEYE